MKQFVALLIIILCSAAKAQAQNYLDHLRQQNQGQGKVTVNQSKAIDELVNGKQNAPQNDHTANSPTAQKKPADANKAKEGTNTAQNKERTSTTQHKQTPDSLKKNEQQHETSKNTAGGGNNATKPEANKEANESPTVDLRKKVMSKSYKTTGYRVQVYAGGNSRNDRQQAEQTGNTIKMKFPDQPVYVHFYSPRWICRMGNFKSLAEAQKVLAKVKALGYKQACLVKGQITVQ